MFWRPTFDNWRLFCITWSPKGDLEKYWAWSTASGNTSTSVGNSSSDDDDGNKNVKNQSLLISCTMALHVRYTRPYNSLPFSATQQREMVQIQRYLENANTREHTKASFPLPIWTEHCPYVYSSWIVRPRCTNETSWNNREEDYTTWI